MRCQNVPAHKQPDLAEFETELGVLDALPADAYFHVSNPQYIVSWNGGEPSIRTHCTWLGVCSVSGTASIPEHCNTQHVISNELL